MPDRFRWTTFQCALDVIREGSSTDQLDRLIGRVGLSRPTSGFSSKERRTIFISNCCEDDRERTDTDGMPLIERIVQEAVGLFPEDISSLSNQRIFEGFRNNLAIDGWDIRDGALIPLTPAPIEPMRSRLRTTLDQLSCNDANNRLDQAENDLGQGHWESANGNLRPFLNAVFDFIAACRLHDQQPSPREGAARQALQDAGFFRRDPRDSSKSFEGDYVQKLVNLLGAEGVHTGQSDQTTAIFRYSIALATADYFLQRHLMDPQQP